MPTYINESNYMQMNRPYGQDRFAAAPKMHPTEPRGPTPHLNQWSRSLPALSRAHQEAHDLDCKQVLRHIQDCPVCQHVFALKTPPTKIVTQTPSIESQFLQSPTLYQATTSTNKIEISISTLILISVFLVIFFIYIIKTARS